MPLEAVGMGIVRDGGGAVCLLFEWRLFRCPRSRREEVALLTYAIVSYVPGSSGCFPNERASSWTPDLRCSETFRVVFRPWIFLNFEFSFCLFL